MPAAIPGTVVSVGSGVGPGGDTGLTGVNGPTAVSTDANNFATLGSDNLISVPGSSIWGMRLRSFNAVGNPNFEVNQPLPSATNPASATKLVDRWILGKPGSITAAVNAGQIASGTSAVVPGTNFRISANQLSFTVTTAQATLAAGDYYSFYQFVEGPLFRELSQDVHSISLLVYSNVAGLKFSVALRDNAAVYNILYLCTIPNANQWMLITLPAIPVWPSGGSFPLTSGNIGYTLWITLACGTNLTAPNTGTWNTSGGYIAAPGTSNFLATVNNTFYCAMVQHEPGPICTTLIDKSFQQNLQECKRYYAKSNAYATKFPANSDWRQIGGFAVSTSCRLNINFEVEMAKSPTVILADNAAVLNQVLVDAATPSNYGATAATITARGIGSCTLSSAPTTAPSAGASILGQWQADTGW